MPSVIYVVKRLAEIKGDESVYKVGRTDQTELKRFGGYDKGSQLYYYERVGNSKYLEPLILQQLRAQFVSRTDNGVEFFEGSVRAIICVIRSVVDEFDEIVT